MMKNYYFEGDSSVPRECKPRLFRKCGHKEHYNDFFRLREEVKFRERAIVDSLPHLSSQIVSSAERKTYEIYVPVDATPGELRTALFHLDVFRNKKAGPKTPIYRKTENGSYVFWFNGSSLILGNDLNDRVYSNITRVEDLKDTGKEIPYIIT